MKTVGNDEAIATLEGRDEQFRDVRETLMILIRSRVGPRDAS
ncbi:MAG: hypothetical protein QM784_30970 [Polyangiaceae bacterium]